MLDPLLGQPHLPGAESGGGQRYRCIPQSAANNLGKIPQKMGALNP